MNSYCRDPCEENQFLADHVERMKGAAPVRAYLSGQQPLVLLIEELSKKKNFRQVVVQHGDLAIRLERQGSAGNP